MSLPNGGYLITQRRPCSPRHPHRGIREVRVTPQHRLYLFIPTLLLRFVATMIRFLVVLFVHLNQRIVHHLKVRRQIRRQILLVVPLAHIHPEFACMHFAQIKVPLLMIK